MKCSICEEEITTDPYGWDGGNNAEPINDGTCCYDCNLNTVLPARLANFGFKDSEIQEVISIKKKEAKSWGSTYTD